MGANVKMAAFVKAFLLPYAVAGHKNKEGAVERPVWVQFGQIHLEFLRYTFCSWDKCYAIQTNTFRKSYKYVLQSR